MIRFVAFVVIVGCLHSCRTGRRLSEADLSRTVFIKVNGLPDADKRPSNLDFVLSECVEATNGKMLKDALQFSSPKIRKGAECVVKAKALSPEADDEFLEEVGVYYLAKGILIREGNGGKLSGTANFQTVYKKRVLGRPTVELVVPVQFDVKPEGQLLTATLTCRPGFIAVATFSTKEDPSRGVFVFSAAFNELSRRIICSEIHAVTDGGRQVFRAKFSPELVFDTAPDLKISAPLMRLAIMNTSAFEEIDTDIEPIFCPDRQVFNHLSARCEECPPHKDYDSFTKTCIEKNR